MTTHIYFLSNATAWITNLLALFLGTIYCYRKGQPVYLWIFPLYLFVSIAIEIVANPFLIPIFNLLAFSSHQAQTGDVIYNFYTVFETFVFAAFFLQVIRSTSMKHLTILLLSLFAFFFTRSSLVNGLYIINDPAILFECAIIIILCLTFFKELFARPEPIDLFKEPSFWLVTGIFFYLAAIFPLFLLMAWLRSHGQYKIYESLYSINNFALCVTHLLFIKGFTCRTKK